MTVTDVNTYSDMETLGVLHMTAIFRHFTNPSLTLGPTVSSSQSCPAVISLCQWDHKSFFCQSRHTNIITLPRHTGVLVHQLPPFPWLTPHYWQSKVICFIASTILQSWQNKIICSTPVWSWSPRFQFWNLTYLSVSFPANHFPFSCGKSRKQLLQVALGSHCIRQQRGNDCESSYCQRG